MEAEAGWTPDLNIYLNNLSRQAQPGGAQGAPMPTSAAEAVKGRLYATPQGLAVWDGKQFVAQ